MTRALFQDVRRSAVAVAFVFAAAQGFPGIAAAGGQVAGQPSQPEAPEAVEQAPAAQPAKPVSDPAQAARSAVEARHAEHMARMEEHQKAMRERAAAQGIDLPEPPPLPEAPKWLSYEEMRAEMKNRGIDMPPLPRQEGGPGLPEPPSMAYPMLPPAAMTPTDPEELKRVFDVIEAMTTEQQEACFSLSRWYASGVIHPPKRGRPMGPQPGYGRGPAPGFGPGHGGPVYGPMMGLPQ